MRSLPAWQVSLHSVVTIIPRSLQHLYVLLWADIGCSQSSELCRRGYPLSEREADTPTGGRQAPASDRYCRKALEENRWSDIGYGG